MAPRDSYPTNTSHGLKNTTSHIATQKSISDDLGVVPRKSVVPSPVLGTNYSEFECFVPCTALQLPLKGV